MVALMLLESGVETGLHAVGHYLGAILHISDRLFDAVVLDLDRWHFLQVFKLHAHILDTLPKLW